MVVPEDVPALTNPLDDPMVAIPVLVLVHDPPLSIAVNVVKLDIQIVDVPEIIGSAFTVAVAVFKQPCAVV